MGGYGWAVPHPVDVVGILFLQDVGGFERCAMIDKVVAMLNDAFAILMAVRIDANAVRAGSLACAASALRLELRHVLDLRTSSIAVPAESFPSEGR